MRLKRLHVVAVLAALVAVSSTPRQLHDSGVPREIARPDAGGAHRVAPAPVRRAQFGDLAASEQTRSIADWIARTGDNGPLPFIVIDKPAAAIFVFDADGRARATAPVLLGIARGDRFAPGVADKDMYHTAEAERITPAGRFVGEAGINDKGQDVVWIQYDAGIAMHAVLDAPGERRRERLATDTPDDNRISYGCVNLPAHFYRTQVRPIFDSTRAVVYVLPDSERPLDLFARN